MVPDTLDRVRWKGEATFRVLSYYFAVRWNSSALGDYACSVLEPFAVPPDPDEYRSPPTPGTPPTYFLVRRGRSGDTAFELLYGDRYTYNRMIAGPRRSDVLTHLFWNINAETTRRTGDFLLIHAGAVVTPGGEGVILPAASGSGKTTMVAGLVRAGFDYLSDEAAAIDPVTGDLHPYPKALTLKTPPEEIFPDIGYHNGHLDPMRGVWILRPDDLRPEALGKPCKVHLIVAPSYRPNAELRLVPMSRAAGVADLGLNALNLPVYRSRALLLLSQVVSGARCFRLEYGDLAAAVQAVQQLTGESPRASRPA